MNANENHGNGIEKYLQEIRIIDLSRQLSEKCKYNGRDVRKIVALGCLGSLFHNAIYADKPFNPSSACLPMDKFLEYYRKSNQLCPATAYQRRAIALGDTLAYLMSKAGALNANEEQMMIDKIIACNREENFQ